MENNTQQLNAAFEAYANAIFRYLVVRLRDRERALELAQETFMKTWMSLEQGTKIENMRAFLYRTAHNLFVNEIRTNRHAASLEDLKEKGFEPAGDVNIEDENKQRQADAIARIHTAAGPYKDVLLLRFVDGLSVKDIAYSIGENENTVSVRIHRGIQKIKKTYEKEQ